MARGWAGSSVGPNGIVRAIPVTLLDRRVENTRELLCDLSNPGVCLVLGAGASYGVVPMTSKEITAIAWKMLKAQDSILVLSSDEKRRLAAFPEIKFLIQLLQSMPTESWDRFVLDNLTQAQAVVILTDVFSPQCEVPSALVRIYGVIENEAGVIVTYNYDGIDEHQSRFPVIAPHGCRPKLLTHPITGSYSKQMAIDFNVIPPTDWHLPVREPERLRHRAAYQEMIWSWRMARSVIFIGYSFGSGADAISFEDFGRNLNPAARVHVLCPRPDNADLCKQIRYGLSDCGSGFRVFGQPFRWRAFSEAVLDVLGEIRENHIRFAMGKEAEIVMAHDRL